MGFVASSAVASIAFAIASSVLQIAVGVIVGWRARASREAHRSRDVLSNDNARELLDRLHALASETAEGVGLHSTRVQEISRDLNSLPGSSEPSQVVILQAAAQILLANEQLQAELASAQTELGEHARLIESHMVEARTDGLVNVPNRRAFDEELDRRFAEWERGGVPLILLMADIDHFKTFNDRHGHQAGDEVLRGVGQVLSQVLGEVAFVARYGGEEFAVVFRATATLDQAKRAAERARQTIADSRFHFESQELRVTISAGLATVRRGYDAATLVKHADEALYAAKENGRNRTYFYNGSTCEPIVVAAEADRKVTPQQEPQTQDAQSPAAEDDRRASPRQVYPSTQRVAAYNGGKLPKPDAFYEVECHNISEGGFSFLSPSRPSSDLLVVALGREPEINYLTARIMHTVQSASDKKPTFIVGCRFTGRLEPGKEDVQPLVTAR